MSRAYIAGLDEVGPSFSDGEVCEQWTCDEDGVIGRGRAFASIQHDVEALNADAVLAASHLGLVDLEWSVAMDRMSLDTLDAEGAREAAHEFASRVQANFESASIGVESAALGLVSVLSKNHGKKAALEGRSKCVPPVRSFRLLAEQAAAVQAAGAFVAGGPEARMAKLRRAVGFAARGHGATRAGHRPDEVRMVTLTLRPGVEWHGKLMQPYMQKVRQWHERVCGIKCRYVWVAEIQDGKRRPDGGAAGARGAVHYHVALWVPQGTPHMPKSDSCGWWPHGSTRTEVAKGAVGYLLHYLKKSNSKNFGEFPNGCRIYSVGGLEHSVRRARRWLNLPSFVQANSSYVDNWNRAETGTGGGWIDPQGRRWPSEFRRVFVGGLYALQRVHTHERSIEASGPFAWLTDSPLALPRAVS